MGIIAIGHCIGIPERESLSGWEEGQMRDCEYRGRDWGQVRVKLVV